MIEDEKINILISAIYLEYHTPEELVNEYKLFYIEITKGIIVQNFKPLNCSGILQSGNPQQRVWTMIIFLWKQSVRTFDFIPLKSQKI